MTSSILTNAAAMTALRTLQATNKSLAITQDRVSTGMKVATAKDNAAAWSVASGMKTESNGYQTLGDQTGVGLAAVGLGLDATKNLVELYEKIHGKALQLASANANSDTAAAAIFTNEIRSLEAAKNEIVSRATFNGVNFLIGQSYTLLTGLDDGATFEISGTDLSGANIASVTNVATANAALTSIRELAATLGAAHQRLEAQKLFFEAMQDALKKGVGSLVDADMTAESARLSALQVQQQLGAQAMSIANQAPQILLSLFN